MLHFADDPMFPARLRVIQIIPIALILGVLLFLGVVLFQQQGQAAPGQFGTLSMLSIAFLAMQLPMAFVLPKTLETMAMKSFANNPQLSRAFENENLRLAEVFALLVRYQVGMIIGYAFLEGAAFVGLIAYMLEGHITGLIVAGICLAAMVLRFPFRSRVIRWVENQQMRLDEIRRQS